MFNDTDTIIPAMPATIRSFMRCIIRFVRTLVLLALLAEAYSFINPSSYVAAYSALESHLEESYLSLTLAAWMAVIRIFFKALHFTFSVEFALLIFGGAWATVEIDTPREWGMVYHLKFPERGYAFRCALSRDYCVVKWFIWYYDMSNRVLDLLGEFAWSVAGQAG
jgi:hypothetical protein